MNNKLKPKRQAIVKNCLNCSKEILLRRKYCSDNCQIVFPIQNSILLGTASARTIKRYLILKDRKCAICNNTKWNNLEITLELDHIDGNSENNNLTNLRLVCPNCHSQTNTYKGKNRGNGRYKRMERYRNNKSW
jgi:5-methylcytosine-specific restriction endonuclease McrA